MSCRRITVEEVKAAYQLTGAAVVQGSYLTDANECCATGALALAIMGIDLRTRPAQALVHMMHGFLKLAIQLAVDNGSQAASSYLSGFIRGFDGNKLRCDEADVDFNTGYLDGRAAWKAVKP